MNSIELHGVVKKFQSFTLGPIDLKVPTGCIMGYIGENGAGKSTTMKLILGLLQADEGEVKIFGTNINEANDDLRQRIGVVLDDINLPNELRLSEVEHLCRYLYKNWEQKRYEQLIEQFHIDTKKRIKELSRGMRMELSLAIALSHHADILILDEATSGLDPVVRNQIVDLLMGFIQDEKHTVFISTHILSDLEKNADYIAFLHNGKLRFVENKDDLYDNYALCMTDEHEVKQFDSKAILGRRIHAFGEDVLVRRNLLSSHLNLQLEPVSIEDIMLFMIKGDQNESTHL